MDTATELIMSITSLVAIVVSVWSFVRYRMINKKMKEAKLQKVEAESDYAELENFKAEIEIVNIAKNSLIDMYKVMSDTQQDQQNFFDNQSKFLRNQWDKQNRAFDEMSMTINTIDSSMKTLLEDVELIKEKQSLIEQYLNGPFRAWSEQHKRVKDDVK